MEPPESIDEVEGIIVWDGWMSDTVEDGCMADIANCMTLFLPFKIPMLVCLPVRPAFASHCVKAKIF